MFAARNTRQPETVKADLATRRAAAEQRARAQIDVLKAEVFLRRFKDTAEALERQQMRAPLGFASLADLMAPQPWAIDNGVVLGHLLTMDDDAYQAAIAADAFDAVSLDEALRMAWDNKEALGAWTRVYTQTLRTLADHAEDVARSVDEQDALQKTTRTASSEGAPREGTGRQGGL